MIVQAILTAIYKHYEDSPLPAFVEGLFYGQAPETTTGAYATYFQVAGSQEYDMSERLEHPLIQFSIWTEDDSPAEAPRTPAIPQPMFSRRPKHLIPLLFLPEFDSRAYSYCVLTLALLSDLV